MLIVDLIEQVDDLHHMCQQARERIQGKFLLAKSEARQWTPRPMPADFMRYKAKR